jgi:hypothetical protein
MNSIRPIKKTAQVTRNVHFIAIFPLKAISLHKRGQIPGMVEFGAVVPQKETAMPYVDFKAVKAAVSIEDAANLLKLPLKKSGNQLRRNCPACGK